MTGLGSSKMATCTSQSSMFRLEREAVRDARLTAVITFGCCCIIAACICGITYTVLTLGAYFTVLARFGLCWNRGIVDASVGEPGH